MIYVVAGHEKSIGLEVFFKSFSLLSTNVQSQFNLIVDQETLIENLNVTNYLFKLNNSTIIINDQFNLQLTLIKKEKNVPLTTTQLEKAEKLITPRDILLTLPTSKDQLKIKNDYYSGYTEYFRKKFNNPFISMLFSSPSLNCLLITDHIKLADIPKTITANLIEQKTTTTICSFEKYFYPLKQVIFSGINPHVGENGILGNEDLVINEAINNLERTFSTNYFKGPYSGDTLHHYESSPNRQNLFVYMYHDQGLPVFKKNSGLIGLNISLGLPFLRMSVDHGTAFEKYGKNCSNYQGCYYMLLEANKVHHKLLEGP